MAQPGFLGFLGILFSLPAGWLLGSGSYVVYERRRRSAVSLGPEKSARWHWRMRNGFIVTRPIAHLLLKSRRISKSAARIEELLATKGIVTSREALVSIGVFVGTVVFLLCFLVTGSLFCGLAVTFGLMAIASGYEKNRREKQRALIRESVPDALRSMGVCFGSGLSLLQTMRQTSHEVKEPLAGLFSNAAYMLETGSTTSEALMAFRDNRAIPELAFVAVALDVQHQSGGSMGHVLDAARESVEGELELTRSLRIQTAQAKLSARIVTLMPFVLIALFSLISDDFLLPFFSSFGGLALLGLALIMQVAGILIVRRMLNLEVSA